MYDSSLNEMNQMSMSDNIHTHDPSNTYVQQLM